MQTSVERLLVTGALIVSLMVTSSYTQTSIATIDDIRRASESLADQIQTVVDTGKTPLYTAAIEKIVSGRWYNHMKLWQTPIDHNGNPIRPAQLIVIMDATDLGNVKFAVFTKQK